MQNGGDAIVCCFRPLRPPRALLFTSLVSSVIAGRGDACGDSGGVGVSTVSIVSYGMIVQGGLLVAGTHSIFYITVDI